MGLSNVTERYFVTGTDTEVGKTYVSCLIVKALREAGINAAGFKMKRTPGIGHKWEILRGEFVGWPADLPAPAPRKPWFARPPAIKGERHALVIGGWSIGLEYVFYFAFPLLAWAAARWKRCPCSASASSGRRQTVPT